MLKTKHNIVSYIIYSSRELQELYITLQAGERDEEMKQFLGPKQGLSFPYSFSPLWKAQVLHMHWERKTFLPQNKLMSAKCDQLLPGNRIIQTQVSNQLKQKQQLLEDDGDLWLQLARLILKEQPGQTEKNTSSTSLTATTLRKEIHSFLPYRRRCRK